MVTERNPYEAPQSTQSIQHSSWTEDEHVRWNALMRSTSNYAIYSGIAFLLLAFFQQSILKWQWLQLLEPYGGADKIGIVMDAHIAPLLPYLISIGTLSAVAVAAGILIRRHQRRGLTMLLFVCSGIIATILWGYLHRSGFVQPPWGLEGAWWLIVLLRAVWAARQVPR